MRIIMYIAKMANANAGYYSQNKWEYKMKLTLVGFIFMYEKVRIFVLNKPMFVGQLKWK